MPRSSTETIISALRTLARDIQSGDGVANATCAEAADRLEEYHAALVEIVRLYECVSEEQYPDLARSKFISGVFQCQKIAEKAINGKGAGG